MRLSKAVSLFLDDCRTRNLAQATRDSYESSLSLLVACAATEGTDSITSFTETVVQTFFATCQKRGNTSSTLIRKRAAVLEFARYCVRRRLLAIDPAANAPAYRLPLRLPRPYTTKERERLMALTETVIERERMIQGRREKVEARGPLSPHETMVRGLLYHAGLRVGTVVRVRLKDIHAGDGEALGQLRVVTKGDREILVPIVPELASLLRDYIIEHTDMQPKSFLLSRKGAPYTVRMIQRMVTGWGRAAEVPGATAHRFRHTAGKEFLETGATLEETQGFLGHANIATTQVYRRVSGKQVGEAALRRAALLRGEHP